MFFVGAGAQHNLFWISELHHPRELEDACNYIPMLQGSKTDEVLSLF